MHDIDQLSGKLLRILRAEGLDYPVIDEAVKHARPKIEAIEWSAATSPSRFSSDAIADEIEDYLAKQWRCLPLEIATRLRDIVAAALKKAASECYRKNNNGFGSKATGVTDCGSAKPLLDLLYGDQEWLINREVVEALGFVDRSGNHSLAGHWGNIDEILGAETRMIEPGGRSKQGKLLRAYSKKAVVLLAMRSRTANAAAFRDWLADRALKMAIS